MLYGVKALWRECSGGLAEVIEIIDRRKDVQFISVQNGVLNSSPPFLQDLSVRKMLMRITSLTKASLLKGMTLLESK